MFTIRSQFSSGDLSTKTEARLLPAIAVAQELREAGHHGVTITDDSDGHEMPLEWWEVIDDEPGSDAY
jgi:hypothetical protein